MLLYINWRLTIVTIIVLALFGVGMAYAFRTLRPLFRERGKINAEVTGRLTEALGGIRIVKSYTAEKREEIVFAKGAHRLFRNVAKSMTGVSATTSGSTVIIGIVGVIMIWLGGRDILAGRMTLGDFIMYIFFIGLVAAPMVSIASIGTQITEAFAGLDRIREILETATEDDVDAGKAALGPHPRRHRVRRRVVRVQRGPAGAEGRQLSCAARDDDRARRLERIGQEHAHQPGDGVQSAAARAHRRGRPRPGDHSRCAIIASSSRRCCRRTSSSTARSPRTSATPIPSASLDEIKAAARVAHCEEFILRFPDGYDTIVGERGIKLSGGQRQRVSIARAILANPRVLILDEATSSLDSESEEMIQDGLRSLREGRTSFVIAHRLSTIRSADQILVLEGGEIVERGTHAELIALNGRYRQLHDKQYKLESRPLHQPGRRLHAGAGQGRAAQAGVLAALTGSGKAGTFRGSWQYFVLQRDKPRGGQQPDPVNLPPRRARLARPQTRAAGGQLPHRQARFSDRQHLARCRRRRMGYLRQRQIGCVRCARCGGWCSVAPADTRHGTVAPHWT